MQIRRYTPADTPKILELIRAVYDENIYTKATQRFQWQYEQNPNNTPEGPIILVLESEDKIIGMLGSFAQRIKIGESVYHAYWTGDFMMHPDFRRGSHGLNLAKAMSLQPYLMMGFPAGHTLKLWLRIGVTESAVLLEYTKVISKKFNGIFKYLGKFLCSLNHAVLSLSNYFNKIKIIKIDHFDERFDRFWDKASKDFKIIQVRDSLYLNWRFLKCPYLSYTVLTALKENEVLGYIVYRSENTHESFEGSVVDLFSSLENTAVIQRLLQAAMQDLKNRGCNVIKIGFSSHHSSFTDILDRFGFAVSDKTTSIFYNNGINGADSILNQAADWYFSKADSDIDFSI